jgi:V/A-type H+-transporting ATPase subunit I
LIVSIVPLDKVTVYGLAAQREAVLDALQGLGVLHLVNLNTAEVRAPAEGLVSSDAREALKFLHTCPVKRRASTRAGGFEPQAIIARTLENKRRQQSLTDERDSVEKAISDLTPWGEFRIPASDDLGRKRLWFYVVPRRDAKAMASLQVPYQIVAEDPTSLYAVAISTEEPESAPGIRVDLDPRPLSELQARRDEIDELLEDLHWERVELTRWIHLLQRSRDDTDDRAARDWAEKMSLCTNEVFAVQGWAPADARPAIEKLALQFGLAVSIASPNDNDRPPTLLRNADRVAGAEGVVTFYITPAYGTWDPTPVMFFSFSLFFGMIVADAGYGLLLAAALGFFWKRIGATPGGARFRNLLLAIVAVTVVFGVLCGSYFGLSPSPDSLLGRLRIFDFADRGQMMAMSILIGVGHLTLANLITAWNARHSSRAIGSLGWVLLMFGALIMATGLLETPFPSTVAPLGKWVILVGAVMILLFSSNRPLRSSNPRDWIGRAFDGVSSLTGVTKLFGDVLSYLRLFALGLASAQLAVTFNQLASDISQRRGLGVLLAAVILIAGHGINLILGLMGGVVHGLRLNCIEFFNWSLTEEGHPFRSYHKKVSI